jgi:hypothetical protein
MEWLCLHRPRRQETGDRGQSAVEVARGESLQYYGKYARG